MSAALLGQRRGADVSRKHVRVAVHIHAQRVGRVKRVIPGSGRQHHHTGTNPVAQRNAGEACSTIVEDSHHVAIGDIPGGRINGVHGDLLTTLDLGVATGSAEVVLAVQSGNGLVRIERQRVLLGSGAPDKLPFITPCRMTAAVIQSERVERFREDLDLARRGRKRSAVRVGPEGLEYERRRWDGLRVDTSAVLPEVVECRQVDVGLGCPLDRLLPQVCEPLALIATFGEFFLDTESLS